jgi:septum formation protein
MDTIILASGSPRRRELLERVRIPCKVVSPQVDETYEGGRTPVDHATALARRKVEAVLALFRNEAPPWVLGADTVVEVDGLVLGKPAGIEEAERFLRLLSGRVHRVHTGLALHAGRERPIEIEAVSTEVRFRTLDDGEIQSALESGEWAGAAGGYRIQERGAFLVEWIRGSWSNVVGLPLEAFYGMLKRTGYRF